MHVVVEVIPAVAHAGARGEVKDPVATRDDVRQAVVAEVRLDEREALVAPRAETLASFRGRA